MDKKFEERYEILEVKATLRLHRLT
jgi:hypothetical protein